MPRQNIAGYDVLAWDSSAEEYPALNIAGGNTTDEGLNAQLYFMGGVMIGVVVADSKGIVSRAGFVPAEYAETA